MISVPVDYKALAPLNHTSLPIHDAKTTGLLFTDSSSLKECYLGWGWEGGFAGGNLSIAGRPGLIPGAGGVVGTTGLKIGAVYLSQELATSYNTIQTGMPVFLEEILLPSVDGTDYFQAKQGGSTWDTYTLKIHGVAPVGTPEAFPASSTGAPATDGIADTKLYATTTFTLENVVSLKKIVLDTRIPIPNTTQTGNKYWLKFVVDTIGIDDTLGFGVLDASLAFANTNKEYSVCGSNGGTAFGWAHPTTKVAAGAQRLFTIGNGGLDTPCPQPNTDWPRCYINTNAAIFPVYSLYGVGRNEGTALSNENVRMYGLYPNPASTKVKVNYDLTGTTNVRLVVIDNLQRVVKDYSMGAQSVGSYAHEINVSDLAAGTYYVQLLGNGQALTQKLQVVR